MSSSLKLMHTKIYNMKLCRTERASPAASRNKILNLRNLKRQSAERANLNTLRTLPRINCDLSHLAAKTIVACRQHDLKMQQVHALRCMRRAHAHKKFREAQMFRGRFLFCAYPRRRRRCLFSKAAFYFLIALLCGRRNVCMR